jgi:pimeloyl-ACP methyl ester carboxylesterase
MFIHGVGADRNIWGDWLPLLAGYYPIISLDLPGHGKSEPWKSNENLNFNFYHHVISSIAEKENKTSIVLIGESMGGTIALYAASKMQDKIKAVATCSTAHRGGNLQHVSAWKHQIADDGLEAWSSDMLEKRFFPSSVTDATLDWFHKAQCNSDPKSILEMAGLLVTSDLTPELNKILSPVLLMHPDSSPFIPLDIPVELKALLPAGQLKLIPKARHGIACSHASDCAIETRKFLQSI